MTEDGRPTPEITPETKPYWDGAACGRLLLRECRSCDLLFHYPRARCPDCLRDDVEWREVDGTGEIYSYSVARKMVGWPDKDLPLVVSYVELDEGPRMLTNVRGSPDEIEVGTRVRVRFADRDDGRVSIPVFVPVKDR